MRRDAPVARTPSFRIGEVAALLGASADTVRRLTDAGRLRTRRTAAGHRVVDGGELARFLTANLESPEEDGQFLDGVVQYQLAGMNGSGQNRSDVDSDKDASKHSNNAALSRVQLEF